MDITDRVAVDAVLRECQPETVYHLAAETHVDRSIDSPAEFIQTNVVGTSVLLEAALSYWSGLDSERRSSFRFVHVSTDEVYGTLGPVGAFNEESVYRPNSPYAASKAASDHLARAWHITYGLPTVVTSCGNNYGPYQFPEKLIPLVILSALDGRPLPVYGDGGQVRDWIHVDDHVSALRTVGAHGIAGSQYAIGALGQQTNISVVRKICSLLDELAPRRTSYNDLICHVADRPGHDRRYAIDPTKIMNELGWRAQHSFDDGLAVTVRWFLENQDWAKATEQKYQRTRLGLHTTA